MVNARDEPPPPRRQANPGAGNCRGMHDSHHATAG